MKIVSIPFSGGGLGHGNGANKAPKTIIEQLKDMYSNEDGIEINFEYEKIYVNENNVSESHKNIKQFFENLKKVNDIISLGGDHSVTHPILKGVITNLKKNSGLNHGIKLIVFDAHPDLMDDFRPPTQEDYLRVIIEENIVKPEDIILIGIRNWDKEEIAYIKDKGIKNYTMKRIFDIGIKKLVIELINIIKTSGKDVYLSLDIDVVDPVEAIGTGYIEHGGLSSRDLIYIIQQLKQTNKIIMSDIVEVNPSKDVNNITSKLAAKILMELSSK